MAEDYLKLAVDLDQNQINQVMERLNIRSTDVPKKTFISAARNSIRVLMDKARTEAPFKTGALKKSQGIRVKAYPSSHVIFAIAGERKGIAYDYGASGRLKRTDKGHYQPWRYAHLVEFGHKNRSAMLTKKTKYGKVYEKGYSIALGRLAKKGGYQNGQDYFAKEVYKNYETEEHVSLLAKRYAASKGVRQTPNTYTFKKNTNASDYTPGRYFMTKSFSATASQVILKFIEGVKQGVEGACKGQKPADEGAAA
jgi:hypothetical protein